VSEPPPPSSAEAIASAEPQIPTLDLRVAQARAEAALFGASEAVKIGRYRVIERIGAGGMGVVWSAWDPTIGRAVALKLASSGDAVARARARDEGRALGRLSHPNVVPIYDVLDHDERVFLVMELVKGETLRAAGRARTPAQLIRDYRQAADGLAAAHRAGLIHRDFKPDNAILGDDGRVRVLDFGLADEAGGGDGRVAGTRGYMAPEQEAGAALTEAVDQYALCVSLREALVARGGVPRWLAPLLARGTAARPEERFPSMEALAAALALDPMTRWRRRGLVAGAALAVAAAGAAFWLGQARSSERVEPCSGAASSIAASWGPARRAELARHLRGLGGSYVAEAGPRVVATLDRYADAWVALHRASCLARERRELSDAAYDRRLACLARPRAALAAVAALTAATTVGELPGLVRATAELPDPAACDDDAALAAGLAPPPTAQAAEVAAIDAALVQLAVERDAGRTGELGPALDAAVARAEATGYRPLIARARLARGRLALTLDDDGLGVDDFAIAQRAALAGGELALAIEAWARRAWASATAGLTDATQAIAGLEIVRGLDDSLGPRGQFARALLENNLGSIALGRGDRALARARFEQARVLARELGGPGAIELTAASQNLLLVLDDDDHRRAVGRELSATLDRLLGSRHPQALSARAAVALADRDDARALAELTAVVEQLAADHPSRGGLLAEVAHEPLWLAARAGEREVVARLAARVAAAASTGAPGHELTWAAAFAAWARGDAAAATAQLTELRAQLAVAADAPWWQRKRALDVELALLVVAPTPPADPRGAAALLAAVGPSMAPVAYRRRAAALAALTARP
jgi:hypothetical protein